MASGTGSVWALDIGNSALKALRLTDTDQGVEVTSFECISYGKILSGSGVKPTEREELIAFAVRQFVKSNNIGKDDVVVSVPGQNSFARFVKLPPFDKKQIPEMVKYEAAQQIPFDMNDVQWDWQLMTEPDDPEAKVGLFAIKTDIVTSELEYFSRENLQVSCVQMVPMALYNYLVYDRPELTQSDSKATIVLNIGAENSDLIVCTKSLVWQRSIPMGGNAFTRAIADAFKLNFAKAEKLKRTAAMSKYARQIFQAMKPVFTDFAAEVQRSLGFYSSSNPNTSFTKVVALGGGIKMRGLLKYLQQTLQIPVESPDLFKKLKVDSDDQAKFHENINDFAVVYGLGLQGLGMARIESNLLPTKVARQMNWKNKTKFFVLAACMLFAVSVAALLRANLDRVSYNGNSSQRNKVANLIRDVEKAKSQVQMEQEKVIEAKLALDNQFATFSYRDVIPKLHETIIGALPNAKNNPLQKGLYEAFASKDVDSILSVPRKRRKQLLVTSFTSDFVADVEIASFGSGKIAKKSTGSGGYTEMEYAQPGGARDRDRGRSRGRDEEEEMLEVEEELGGAGFVVTITGYCPYGNINELLDPAGVEDIPGKWGFITRLMHLDEIVDGNSPFALFGKTDPQHFSVSTGVVTLNSKSTKMPKNIGVLKKENIAAVGKRKSKAVSVLVDPMTGEVMSQQVKLNEDGQPVYDRRGKVVYEVQDRWFIFKAKFVWKDSPTADLGFEDEQEDRGGAGGRRPLGRGAFGGGAIRASRSGTEYMKKNVKLDMTQIKEALQKLSFLKSYSFLLLPVLIVIGAILVYIPTPIMNGRLQQKIQKESLAKGNSLARMGDEVVSKDQWIQEQKLSDAYLLDVEKASELALEAGQREQISYNIFPAPKDSSVTIFKQFGQTFQNKLESFVKSASGGDRPSDIELGLSGGRGGSKSSVKISDKVRNALCLKRAQAISFYASVYDMMFYNYWSVNDNNMGQGQGSYFEYTGVDSAVESCWYTQVGYWIIEDVIATIKAVNGSSSSVYSSAVKRLLDFNFGLGDGSQSSSAKALPEYAISSDGTDDYRRGSQDAGPVTLTGRSSNAEVDMVYFNMSLAIDSASMMEFMKELCSAKKHSFIGFDGQSAKHNYKHNQITILDADFEVINRDAAAHKYYRYGDAAVVELVLSCEYVFSKKGYFDIKPVTIKTLLNEELETFEDEELENENIVDEEE